MIVGTTGNLSGTSAVTVNANATLQVDGTINTASTETINANGTLRGLGTVGNLTVSGTVQGGDAGNATVGNLTAVSADFSGGGTLRARVSSGPFRSDELLLTGTGSTTLVLGGSSKLVLDESGLAPSGSSPALSTNLVTFTNNGALTATGTFSSVTQTGNAVDFSPAVTYNPGGVQVSYAGNVAAAFAAAEMGGVAGSATISLASARAVSGQAQSVTVALLDTGLDLNNPATVGNIWINQAEIPATVLPRLTDVFHDGMISFRDLQAPINQGPGKIEDVYHDGYISVRDLLAPISMGGWATGQVDRTDGYVDDIVGWNFVANNNNPYDDNGHGTFSASVLTQIDSGAVLMPLKILDASGQGSTTAAAEAMNYAVQHGARVVLDAWASETADPAFAAAVANAANAGTLIVQAAGNNDPQALQALVPIHGPNLLIVGASDGADQLASFSNANAGLIDIAAPGVGIVGQVQGGTLATHDGTSVSSAFVAGAAALEFGLHPGQNFLDVRSAILNGADQVAGLATGVAGGRRLDLAGMLRSGDATPAVSSPTAAVFQTVQSSSASVSQPGVLPVLQIDAGQDVAAAAVSVASVSRTGIDQLFQQNGSEAALSADGAPTPRTWLSAFEGAAAQVAANLSGGSGDDGSVSPDDQFGGVDVDLDLQMLEAIARR